MQVADSAGSAADILAVVASSASYTGSNVLEASVTTAADTTYNLLTLSSGGASKFTVFPCYGCTDYTARLPLCGSIIADVFTLQVRGDGRVSGGLYASVAIVSGTAPCATGTLTSSMSGSVIEWSATEDCSLTLPSPAEPGTS